MIRRIIFSVNPGRCGTLYLYNAFTAFTDVLSAQEHRPTFVGVQGKAQHNRRYAKKWLKSEMIPWIGGDSAGKTIYLKTSHVFGHGFVEPMIDTGVPFEVLFIHRDIREVSLSMWRMGYIPVRWFRTDDYFLRPECRYNVLRVKPSVYKSWSDYQFCYWHTLEMAGRAVKYKRIFAELEIPYYETTYPDFTSKEGLLKLSAEMRLGYFDEQTYQEVDKKGKINATYLGVRNRTFAEIDDHEQAVRKTVSEHLEELGGLHIHGGAV